MVGDHFDIEDQPPRLVGHQIGPIVHARRADRRGNDLEVFGFIVIGQDVERAAPFLDRIFGILVPLFHAERRAAVFRVDQPDFRGLMVMRRDGEVTPRLRHAHADEKPSILFFINNRIIGLAGPQHMLAHPEGAMVLVELDIIEPR